MELKVLGQDTPAQPSAGRGCSSSGCGSGSGKSTLLREMIMLQEPDAGSIQLFGTDMVGISTAGAQQLRRRFGVLFQQGALFSGLTVLENVGVPLREHTRLDTALIDELARLKIVQAGLERETA